MTNHEQFQRPIEQIGKDFSVCKNGQIVPCRENYCDNCIFCANTPSESCGLKKQEWLYQEAKFPKKGEEKGFIVAIDRITDKNGKVYGQYLYIYFPQSGRIQGLFLKAGDDVC